MFDWIPPKLYASIFYHLMMVVTLIVLIHSLSFDLKNQKRISEIRTIGAFLLIAVILYMGLRPISGYFGDMPRYNYAFLNYQNGAPIKTEGDWLFNNFMWLSAQIMPAKFFFLVIDILYIVPMYLFSKKHFKRYWALCFILFLASFSFWSYGTNGIRNGLATSLFIWGLAYYNERKWLMYVLFAMSFFMHASLIIPIAAFITSYFLIKNPQLIFLIWVLSIPLSLAGQSFWIVFFEGLGLLEDRTIGYLNAQDDSFNQIQQTTKFRWDFLLYSTTGILAGYYYIIKKKLKDTFYIHLFGIYAIANAFWILVITAAFSNRFAYLSWFLMAPVIIYPLCKYNMLKNQYKVLGAVVFLYFLFTYVMFMK